MCNWGKFWTKRFKKTKTTQPNKNNLLAISEKLGAGTVPFVHGVLPALSTTKGWASYASHPSGPAPGHTPSLTPCNAAVPNLFGPRDRFRGSQFSMDGVGDGSSGVMLAMGVMGSNR